ncbi:MAG TPA: hypothetical protein VK658_14460, partial [Chryseolinea sp.]|nr:hypothetical protein [Chryseolinea sp.]
AITEVDFWERQASALLKIVPVKIPVVADDAPSVSELCYVDKLDMLLMVLSSEHTSNAYDDGIIGNSYIGWIENITGKMQAPILTIDQIVSLTSVHRDFNNEKVEGLCVETVNGMELTLHLVSDNDNGESKLFKIGMTLTR